MRRPTIRPYRPDDRAALLAAVEDLQEYERALHESRLPGLEVAASYLRQLLRKTRREPLGAILIAELDGKFAGFIACWVGRDRSLTETADFRRYGYVSDIHVAPEQRGNGIAGLLLRAAERHLAGAGVRYLRLDVLAANASALTAYRKYGFQPHEVSLQKRIKRRT